MESRGTRGESHARYSDIRLINFYAGSSTINVCKLLERPHLLYRAGSVTYAPGTRITSDVPWRECMSSISFAYSLRHTARRVVTLCVRAASPEMRRGSSNDPSATLEMGISMSWVMNAYIARYLRVLLQERIRFLRCGLTRVVIARNAPQTENNRALIISSPRTLRLALHDRVSKGVRRGGPARCACVRTAS